MPTHSSSGIRFSAIAIRFVVVAVAMFGGCQDKSNPLTVQVPVSTDTTMHITSIFPTHGRRGSKIIISGKNFGKTKEDNKVAFFNTAKYYMYIGPVDSLIKSFPFDSLFITVPDYGDVPWIVTAPILLRVGTDTSYSDSSFYLEPRGHPHFASLNPGRARVGDSVTIKGSGFDADTKYLRILLDTMNARVLARSIYNDVIIVRVPAIVTTAPFKIFINSDTLVTSPFTVIPPVIKSFTPASGTAGTKVLLQTNCLVDSSISVMVGSVPAKVDSFADSVLLVTVPENAVSGLITMHIGQCTASSQSLFEVIPRQIVSFSPTHGCAVTPISLKMNFRVGGLKLAASVNSVSVPIISQMDSTVVVLSQGINSSGTIEISFGNTMVKSGGVYTVDSCPISIAKFEPISGHEGDTVKIFTTGILDASNLIVKFGETVSNGAVVHNGVVYATVPLGARTAPIAISYQGEKVTTDSTFIVRGHGLPFNLVTVEVGNAIVQLETYESGQGSVTTTGPISFSVDNCNFKGVISTSLRQSDSLGVTYSIHTRVYKPGLGYTDVTDCESSFMLHLDTAKHSILSCVCSGSFSDDNGDGRNGQYRKDNSSVSCGSLAYTVKSDETWVAEVRGQILSSIISGLTFGNSSGSYTSAGGGGGSSGSESVKKLLGFSDSSFVRITMK